MAAITIRVFASHPVAAAQYTRLLAAEKDFRVVATDIRFQVGVFDTEGAAAETLLTVARLKFPTMRPVLLSFPCDDNECLRWLFRGAWGLVEYDRYEEELPRAARHVAGGQLWFPAPVVRRWMHVETARRTSSGRLPLTPREHEVMEFLLRRFSNKEIADILGISERTVKYHVTNILNKLQLTSRAELLAKRVPDFGLT